MSRGWSHVAELLAEAGCVLVTGVAADEPGLLDAGEDTPGLRAVGTRDQRVAAALAAGHALLTGRPAVLALSTGPAFTNAIAALAEAASMCAPIVVVTTRVAIGERGRGAFQEIDQQGLAAAFAKWRASVEHPQQLRWALRRAVSQAINGRPGVAVVEIAPEALADAPPSVARRGGPLERARAIPLAHALDRAARLLSQARAPVVVLGGGARGSDARAALARLAEVFVAAYCTTASGRGAIVEDHPLACGNVGLYASAPIVALLEQADVVLAIGTQLEETARMRWPRLRAVELIHLDCDAEVLGRALEPTIGLLGDAAATCVELARRLARARVRRSGASWRMQIERARANAIAASGRVTFVTLPSCAVLRALSAAFPDAVFVQENGLQDLWGYNWPAAYFGAGHAFIAPGEQTLMGFGIGAAVGAALALPDRVIVATCGDGALGMSLAALPTAAECDGRLLLVMWDNHGLGWPRLSRARSAARPRLTDFATSPPAVQAVRAAGGEARLVEDQIGLERGIEAAREALANRRLALLAVATDVDSPPPPAARELEDAATT